MSAYHQAVILIVDENTSFLVPFSESYREYLSDPLKGMPRQVLTRQKPDEALEVLEGRPINLLVSDRRFSDWDARDFFKRVREISPQTQVVALSNQGFQAPLEAGVSLTLNKPRSDLEALNLFELFEEVLLTQATEGLKGRIQGGRLKRLINRFCLEGLSAIIEVRCGSGGGWIYIQGGGIVHAQTLQGQVGRAAIFELVNQRKGRFQALPFQPPPQQSLRPGSWEYLLDAESSDLATPRRRPERPERPEAPAALPKPAAKPRQRLNEARAEVPGRPEHSGNRLGPTPTSDRYWQQVLADEPYPSESSQSGSEPASGAGESHASMLVKTAQADHDQGPVVPAAPQGHAQTAPQDDRQVNAEAQPGTCLEQLACDRSGRLLLAVGGEDPEHRMNLVEFFETKTSQIAAPLELGQLKWVQIESQEESCLAEFQTDRLIFSRHRIVPSGQAISSGRSAPPRPVLNTKLHA